MQTPIQFLNYQITDTLQEAAYWSLFRAKHLYLEREVQVLVVEAPSAAVGDQLRIQAGQLFHLQHPYAVALLDFFEIGNLFYFIYERVLGTPLLEQMATPKTEHDWTQLMHIFLQLTHLLASAHQQGIIHGALCPEYIFIDKYGQCKVLHFSYITSLICSGQPPPATLYPYLAPELIQHGMADKRSDIYALGAILYHWLTGQPPVNEEKVDPLKIRTAIPLPSVKNPGLSPLWDELVMQCLEQKANLRFPIIEELEDAFVRTWTESNPQNQSAQTMTSKTLMTVFWVVTGLIVLASLWIIGQELFSDSQPSFDEAAWQSISTSPQQEPTMQKKQEETSPKMKPEDVPSAPEPPQDDNAQTQPDLSKIKDNILVDGLYMGYEAGKLNYKIRVINLNVNVSLAEVLVLVSYEDDHGETIASELHRFEGIPANGSDEKLVQKDLPAGTRFVMRLESFKPTNP